MRGPATVKRKEELRTREEDAKERYLKVYKEEKRKVKGVNIKARRR